MPDPKRELLQHFLAALAYRTQKAVRGAPAEYADFRAADGVRTPHQLVHHMSGVLLFALTHFEPVETWLPLEPSFQDEIDAFHRVLDSLRRHLEGGMPITGITPERLLQGPFADAMTHAGQLAMLRRLAGAPIPPEDFSKADIDRGNVGPTQPPAVSPDAVWEDAEGRRQDR